MAVLDSRLRRGGTGGDEATLTPSSSSSSGVCFCALFGCGECFAGVRFCSDDSCCVKVAAAFFSSKAVVRVVFGVLLFLLWLVSVLLDDTVGEDGDATTTDAEMAVTAEVLFWLADGFWLSWRALLDDVVTDDDEDDEDGDGGVFPGT